MTKNRYVYRWRNNAKRATLYGRLCSVVARGRRNSCLVEFADNRQREIVSRNAIRKEVKNGKAAFYKTNIRN